MATDYTIGDREYWVDKCKKRGWYISKLFRENENLEIEVARLKAQNQMLKIKVKRSGH